MRSLGAALLVFALAACDSGPLGPVPTLDGTWGGTAPGYTVTLTLQQRDTTVTGGGVLAGVAGAQQFDVTGTNVMRKIALTLSAPGYIPLNLTGTLSSVEAVIDGHLDGSGFNNLSITLQKRR